MRYHLTLPLALLISTVLAGCAPAEIVVQEVLVRPVKLFEVATSAGNTVRQFPARVEANSRAELSFRISGQLVRLDLVEGQHVKQGFLLAQLDDRDAHNNLMTREAEYDLMLADFTRNQTLLDRKLISQALFDSSKAQLKSAKAALAAANDQVSYTRLEAPFSGTIAKRLVDNHQIVQANQGVLTLQNNQLLDVTIQVPEAMAAVLTQDIAHGLAAKVRFSALDGMSFDAKFKEYSTQVTPGTQAYEVVFSLPQPKNVQLLPGMSAELTLATINESSQGFTAIVPISAVDKQDESGDVMVWRYQAESGDINPVKVTLGRVSNNGVEVLTGLEKGDVIVAAGLSQLSEGMKVKPLRWQRGV
ncbi:MULTISPECIES: efflux RND transporter periplasmic adaptor subunit [Shewanella]|uniref:Efflux RND transporter periplasmic adaptor subunit n=1 Tax=Shewanella polaris TaxID=2588449 RepID=A0A4Y5YFY7_9GAMM|nr:MULTISPECIES: efflux RND transporter periplasmic adaptor subunit [Shewanella]QDE31701.1 efflux RND transporter periplasmic adaptor subunit [Shewanella polaris]